MSGGRGGEGLTYSDLPGYVSIVPMCLLALYGVRVLWTLLRRKPLESKKVTVDLFILFALLLLSFLVKPFFGGL